MKPAKIAEHLHDARDNSNDLISVEFFGRVLAVSAEHATIYDAYSDQEFVISTADITSITQQGVPNDYVH